MKKYPDIVKRLNATIGGSRELDAIIQMALFPDFGTNVEVGPARYVRFQDVWFKSRAEHINHAIDVADWWKVPAYTASIDAALGLVEKMLPSPELEMTNLYGVARVTLFDDAGPFYGSDEGNRFEIAILLALFSALEAKEDAA